MKRVDRLQNLINIGATFSILLICLHLLREKSSFPKWMFCTKTIFGVFAFNLLVLIVCFVLWYSQD